MRSRSVSILSKNDPIASEEKRNGKWPLVGKACGKECEKRRGKKVWNPSSFGANLRSNLCPAVDRMRFAENRFPPSYPECAGSASSFANPDFLRRNISH
jgi:hypothetical protein